jgi:glycosyltransferase A (GT-A) superfamily protein (DUF2064 family)
VENSDRVAVMVMATAPRAGAVKPRLCSVLGPTEAAELACCVLFDTLDGIRALAPARRPLSRTRREAERGFFATTGTILVPSAATT